VRRPVGAEERLPVWSPRPLGSETRREFCMGAASLSFYERGSTRAATHGIGSSLGRHMLMGLWTVKRCVVFYQLPAVLWMLYLKFDKHIAKGGKDSLRFIEIIVGPRKFRVMGGFAGIGICNDL